MRKLVVAVVCMCLCWRGFAQEEPSPTEGDYSSAGENALAGVLEEPPVEEAFADEDPFADLFTVAEDVSVENQEPVTPNSVAATEEKEEPKNFFYKPLTFSGHLEAQVGVSGEFKQDEADATGFLLFKNDLFVSARTSKNLGMSGTLTIQYPDFSLFVKSLYFDYLLLDKVYVSGGKKTINWGYVQLFSDMSIFTFDFHYELTQEKKYIPTNILSDSGSMISLHVQVPVWTGTVSGVMLYPTGRKSVPSIHDFTFAGSVEMTVWETAVNVFGRKNPSAESELSQNGAYKPPVLGMEFKRTLLGNDVYGQVVVAVQDFKSLESQAGYESVVSTAGFYRYWDGIIPKVGINLEYQHVYTPGGGRIHTHKTAFLGGLSGFGSKKNMRFALAWNHEYMTDDGNLKLGFTVSNVLPHANWNAGLEMVYGGEFSPVPKFTLATSVTLLMDY